jgi:hypothetical protein
VKLLSEALMTELEANQSILLHGGPQSSRRAVLLLNKLGKAHQVRINCSKQSNVFRISVILPKEMVQVFLPQNIVKPILVDVIVLSICWPKSLKKFFPKLIAAKCPSLLEISRGGSTKCFIIPKKYYDKKKFRLCARIIPSISMILFTVTRTYIS